MSINLLLTSEHFYRKRNLNPLLPWLRHHRDESPRDIIVILGSAYGEFSESPHFGSGRVARILER